jgi:hypothetical protein
VTRPRRARAATMAFAAPAVVAAVCQARGKPPHSPCPLYRQCPRWDGPDDYYSVMEETPEQTEQRRSAWPCSRLAGLLSPELRHIGPG